MGDLIFGSRGNLGKFLGKAHRNGKKGPNLELPLSTRAKNENRASLYFEF